jgi:signal transduction histidine kinase
MTVTSPIPSNESERLAELADFDIDFTDSQNNFKELTELAAKIAGTPISMINLIDNYTLWSISTFGMDNEQTPREESICQYTIMENHPFEVRDLANDARFQEKEFVTDEPNLRYYLGVPLRSKNGLNLGSLCVMDRVKKALDPEKIELLKIIANEIVKRLRSINVMRNLQEKVVDLQQTQKKIAHDIRGPLGGIIGLSQIISDQGEDNNMDEVLEAFSLIQKSGTSILELADEILTNGEQSGRKQSGLMGYQLNLLVFKEKIEKLYQPQARNKNITFTITTSPETETVSFSKNKLMQITGNLISNSMKFTPDNGTISVTLVLKMEQGHKVLSIKVKDSGIGLSSEKIDLILAGTAASTDGTNDEKGYGFGLALVKHLVDSMRGTMKIHSSPGKGAEFEIMLVQN